MTTVLILGDSRERLSEIDPETIDALVCDPPYEYGFMGKAWDGTGIAFSVDFWRQCYAVMKPGAHLIAFGATRTHHRIWCAIEDAGFEIRDTLQWMFGSGFPKSLDVGKAIDSHNGDERPVVGLGKRPLRGSSMYADDAGGGFREEWNVTSAASAASAAWDGWGTALKPAHETVLLAVRPHDSSVADANLSAIEESLWQTLRASDVDLPSASSPADLDAGGFDGARWSAGEQISTWGALFDRTAMSQSGAMVSMCWNTVRSWRRTLAAASEVESTSTIGTGSSLTIDLKTWRSCLSALTPESIIQAATSEHGSPCHAERAALISIGVGRKLSAIHTLSAPGPVTSGELARLRAEVEAAPYRPILLARKPLAGTVAATVLEHGTGGVNVDGCRVGVDGGGTRCSSRDADGNCTGHPTKTALRTTWHGPDSVGDVGGRWPPNILLTHAPDCGTECADGCPVAELDRQSGEGVSTNNPRHNGDFKSVSKGYETAHTTHGHSDSGGASRFFPTFRYVAKASRSEREAGTDGLPAKVTNEDTPPGTAGSNSPRAGANRNGAVRNHHPTVKPIDLMRWLCRLVTPPGGIVLDPFMGSGTTGVAARLEGFRFVGIEMDPDYYAIARSRIEHFTTERVEDDSNAPPRPERKQETLF